MYIRTGESFGYGLGQPPSPPASPLRIPTFTSSTIRYKDNNQTDTLRPTLCSTYVPSALRNQKLIDLMVFFHGWDTCAKKHKFDPELVIKNFRLDDQVEKAIRKVALVVPSLFWDYHTSFGSHNGSDLRNIRVAWSAAYLNDFVNEVLSNIGKSSGIARQLGNLVLAGHSGAYDILTPLADQFLLGVPATGQGALSKLNTVLAMDTTYGLTHAKSLELWARNLGKANFTLVLSNGGAPPDWWKTWRQQMDKAKVAIPTNLKVVQKVGKSATDGHCEIVENYLGSFLV